MDAPKPRFEIRHRHWLRPRWWWVLVDGADRVVASSVKYPSKEAAKVSVAASRHIATAAPLWDPVGTLGSGAQ